MPSKFGTILVDPPWPYQPANHHDSLTGYSNYKYEPMSIADLAALTVNDYADEDAVLLLWTTWPMLQDALGLIEAWGFRFVTGLPWVKTTGLHEAKMVDAEGERIFVPAYGVGYWMRGCSEPILIAKRPKGRSVRTQWIGLLADRAKHSQKPESVYQLAESFRPKAPRLELFAREPREGWTQYGDAIDGRDIREVMAA